MADTSVTKEIEEYIRNVLSEEYKCNFSEKKIRIGIKRDGTNASYKFDIVSDDESIIGGIKSHSGRTGSGKFPRAKLGMSYTEIYFLSRTEAKKKIFVLTNKEFYDIFYKDSDGKIPEDIEVRYIELPEELNKKWKASIEAGRKEMGY